MTDLTGNLCLECYKGYLQPQRGVGRMFEVRRGLELELPHDLDIPTCDHCNELWFTGEMLERIVEILRPEVVKRS